jgi:hypothetical protein
MGENRSLSKKKEYPARQKTKSVHFCLPACARTFDTLGVRISFMSESLTDPYREQAQKIAPSPSQRPLYDRPAIFEPLKNRKHNHSQGVGADLVPGPLGLLGISSSGTTIPDSLMGPRHFRSTSESLEGGVLPIYDPLGPLPQGTHRTITKENLLASSSDATCHPPESASDLARLRYSNQKNA